MAIRIDTGQIQKVHRTPQGGIRVVAALTRTGVFRYHNADGSERLEWRPPEEVFRADALAQLEGAPVTNLHPLGGLVTPENFSKTSTGHATKPRQEDDHIVAELVVQDGPTIADIKNRSEVSLGYRCRLDETPGVTPDGERYDAVQRDIENNHVALVPSARGGRTLSLRLDSEGDQVPETPKERMDKTYEIIAGIRHEEGSESHAAAVKVRNDASEDLAKITAERDLLQVRVDGIAAEVAARVEVVQTAAKHGVAVTSDMSDGAIRDALLAKVAPQLRLDGKDDAYKAAALDIALSGSIGNGGRVRDALRFDASDVEDEGPPPWEIAAKKAREARDASASNETVIRTDGSGRIL